METSLPVAAEVPARVVSGECHELKSIKYKSMLLKGAPVKETRAAANMANLEKFLEAEKETNSNEPWCKLNKTLRNRKLLDYVEIYKQEKALDTEEARLLMVFLKDCLDKKRLCRVKDVVYDRTTGTVKEIPALAYHKPTKHFTLRNMDNKRVSTLKALSMKKSTTRNNKTAASTSSDVCSDEGTEVEVEDLDVDV